MPKSSLSAAAVLAPAEPSSSSAKRFPGLVSLLTSDTADLAPAAGRVAPGRFVIDRHAARIKRMRRSVITAARAHEARMAGKRGQCIMITTTYRDDVCWCPKDITAMVKTIREFLRRRGHVARYVWVAELTKRGRVHFHVVLWLPRGVRLPKPDQAGWWPHGWTRIERVRRAVGYIAKYASKGSERSSFPRGLRLSAAGGLSEADARLRRWWVSPSWVRSAIPDADDDARPAPGGGWVAKRTGAWFPSPWGIVAVGRSTVLVCRL